MTREDINRDLSAYKRGVEKLAKLTAEREQYMTMGTNMSPVYSHTPTPLNNSGKVEPAALALAALDREIDGVKDKLPKQKERVLELLGLLSEGVALRMMMYHYVECREMSEIEALMNYSYSRLRQLRSDAIGKITEKIITHYQ